MKHVSQAAQKIVDKLVQDLDNPGDAKTFDAHGYTEKWDGGIMAVHVENIGHIKSTGTGNLYSITHYYKQNGDMMRDPEMIFWGGRHVEIKKGKVVDIETYYPVYFRQDGGIPIEQESVIFEDGKVSGYRPRMQADHTKFANVWMKNIKEQQSL